MTPQALVTGSKGFVGRHVITELIARGYDVTGWDAASAHPRDARLMFLTETHHFDLIVHCAANVGGRVAIDSHGLWQSQNLGLDASMFEFAARTQAERVVYFSSSAAYPTDLQQESGSRLTEAMIDLDGWTMPDRLYGSMKIEGERVAREYRKATERYCLVVRPFSGYGADQDEDYPFPAFVRRACEQSDVFPIWGSQKSERDWIHVDDVVGGVFALLDAHVQGPVNLCTGQATAMWQLAEHCMTVATGAILPIVERHDKPQGVFSRVGDPMIMKDYYTPRVSLSEGVERAVSSYRATH